MSMMDDMNMEDPIDTGYSELRLTGSQVSIRKLASSEPDKAFDQIAVKYAEKKREIEKLETALSSVRFKINEK